MKQSAARAARSPTAAPGGGRVRVGLSGWRYPPWRGHFYPRGLPQRDELRYAGACFETLELNGTFYSLQRPERFAAWYAATPPAFRFAVKGARFITHMKRLVDVVAPLGNFFASGVLRLEEKLGPVLWQLPADFRFDAGRIEGFLAMLPRDFESAARLGRRHDRRLPARAWLRPRTRGRIRHALEFRHPSFCCEQMVRLARRHRVALAFSHTAGIWPYVEEVTTDFVYVRLHGPGELYASDYDARARARWAARARSWRDGGQPADAATITGRPPPRTSRRDVWIFFDNTDKRHAPANAAALAAALAPGPAAAAAS